ncbi:MAG TPA: cytochrome P460 family protein [Abditibacteriaceae bacterium]|jgi:hypothetical protein
MNNFLRFSFLLSLCAVTLTISATAKSKSPEEKPKVPAIKNYRKWNLANTQPYFVAAPQAVLCAPPSVSRQRSLANPHEDKWIRVWVNEAGREPLLHQKTPVFPRGAVIVKEKLAEKTSVKPELLTVMIKRDKGFDAKNGDWEYYVMNGDATEVHQGGKLQNCQSCHIPQKENGYVFRDYLPEDVRRALK